MFERSGHSFGFDVPYPWCGCCWQLNLCNYSLGITFAVDDVVLYKYGEKSSQALTSTGFQDVTFKSYTRYVIEKELCDAV